MIALSILNIKEFMNILLRTEAFDSFLLSEGSITTYMTFLLEGRPNTDFFSPEDEAYHQILSESYIPWCVLLVLILSKESAPLLPLNLFFSSPVKIRREPSLLLAVHFLLKTSRACI